MAPDNNATTAPYTEKGKPGFLKGNPGRLKGHKDKRNRLRDLMLDFSLGKTASGAIRFKDALRRVFDDDPEAFLKLVGRWVPPPADSQRVATSQLTLAALIQVLDQPTGRIVDARVIEALPLATDECTDGDVSDDGDEAT